MTHGVQRSVQSFDRRPDRGDIQTRRVDPVEHSEETAVLRSLQHHDVLGVGQLLDRVIENPAEIESLRIEFTIGRLELDRDAAGIGMGFGLFFLAEQSGAVGQRDLGDA